MQCNCLPVDIFKSIVERPEKTAYFHFGWHQETASKYINRVSQLVLEIEAYAKDRNLELKYSLE